MFFYEFDGVVIWFCKVSHSTLPLCSKSSCASSYRARFPNSDTAEGSEQRREATVTDPDCRATGLDVAENPPQASAQSGPAGGQVEREHLREGRAHPLPS